MINHDRKDVWSEENPSERQGPPALPTGKPGEPAGATVRPKVLARLPNLDVAEADRVAGARPPRTSHRKLQRRISAAVLIGGTLALVAVAVYPHLRNPGRYVNGKWETETLAPNADVAPTFDSAKQAQPAQPQSETVEAPPAIIITPPAAIPGSAPDANTLPPPPNSPITMPPNMPGQPAQQAAPIPALPSGVGGPGDPAGPSRVGPPRNNPLIAPPGAPPVFMNSGRDLNAQLPAMPTGLNPVSAAGAYQGAANQADPYASPYPNTGYVGPVVPLSPREPVAPSNLSANRYGNPADPSTARPDYDSVRPSFR